MYPVHPGAELKPYNNQKALSSEDFAVPAYSPTPHMSKITCALLELAQHIAIA
jgi:hypothetical protein